MSDHSSGTGPEQNRTNWDNLAGGDILEKPGEDAPQNASRTGPWNSAEACSAACMDRDNCLQWRWKPDRCQLGDRPNMGILPYRYWEGNTQDIDSEMMSGWVEERIQTYVDKLAECDVKKAFDV